jgi:hypothetical protein
MRKYFAMEGEGSIYPGKVPAFFWIHFKAACLNAISNIPFKEDNV